MKAKRLVIAEDHKILREGLRALLSDGHSLEIVAEAEDGIEAIRCVQEHEPDLLLLDLSMPRMGGIAVIKDVKSRFPDVKILALTIHESEDYVLEAFRSGANGYCLKDASRKELEDAIKSVLSGKTYLSPGISEKVLDGYLENRRTLKTQSSWDVVTEREKEVLRLVAEGYKNKEIAKRLGIHVKTVEKHRGNVMRKLDIHTASAMTAYAIEKGLVKKAAKPGR